MIRLEKITIGDAEQAAVAEVLASGMIASGPRVREFEEAFAAFVESPAAIACSSGTAGLCVAVSSLGLPAGSKILTTPFSFIATANCILYGNHTPVFADVDPYTFSLTAEGVRNALERDPDIRAIIPVHLYGQPSEIHAIVDIAQKHNIYVIEDCAQAHAATEDGVPVGAIGDLGVFSFYPTKNMMTGEGGIITGRNVELLERCRLYINHGAPQRYVYTSLGFNYRMTSIAAAVGLCQLAQLPGWTKQRQQHAAILSNALSDIPWLTVPFLRSNCQHVYHQYVLKLHDRTRFQTHMEAAGVATAIHYPTTIPDQPYYQSLGYSGDAYPVARQLADEVVSIPAHPGLSEDDLHTIIDAVRSFIPDNATTMTA